MQNYYKTIRGSVMLVISAMIWGAAFVAQSVGMDYMQPITFNTVRCLVGGIVLLPVLAVFRKKQKESKQATQSPKGSDPSLGAAVAKVADISETETSAEIYTALPAKLASLDDTEEEAVKKRALRDLWLGGILCGAVMFLATTIQQFGLLYTSAGKAGFITTLYIVIVPVMGLFFGRRAPFTVWVSAVIALLGLYLLSVRGDFTISPGDFLILLCAFCFSTHIMLVSYFSPRCDGVALSCIQFFVAGFLGLLPMFMLEQPTVSALLSGWVPILYTGVMSSGVAYTLQIIAQKDVNETVASVLMSLESVFSVLTGWLVLSERLNSSEIIGCALIFTAVLLAQLPPTRLKMPWSKVNN